MPKYDSSMLLIFKFVCYSEHSIFWDEILTDFIMNSRVKAVNKSIAYKWNDTQLKFTWELKIGYIFVSSF